MYFPAVTRKENYAFSQGYRKKDLLRQKATLFCKVGPSDLFMKNIPPPKALSSVSTEKIGVSWSSSIQIEILKLMCYQVVKSDQM